MNMPSFAAEASLYKTRNHYRLSTGWVQTSEGEAVLPQQYNPTLDCNTNASCWLPFWMNRDHCWRLDGSQYSSLWYVVGACVGLFGEFFEIEF